MLVYPFCHYTGRKNQVVYISLLLLWLCSYTAYAPKAVASKPIAPLKIACHPDYPPVMFVKHHLPMGIIVDIATDILSDLGVPYELTFAGPWKRVQQSARLGKIDMIAGIYHNQERVVYLDYTLPVIEDPVVIFVWKGKEFTFNSLDDLVTKTGTTNLGESFGNEVDAFLEEKVSIQRVVRNEMNFKLLDLGRVDFFIFGLYPGNTQTLEYGYEGKVVHLPNPVTTENYHIAFSKKSPYRHLIPKINDQIKAKVTPEKIRQLNNKNLKLYIGE